MTNEDLINEKVLAAIRILQEVIVLILPTSSNPQLRLIKDDPDELRVLTFPTTETDNGDPGLKSIPKKPLLEVIKDMLIELDIKGSLRQRPSGLIEFRNQTLGSVYGRTEEEIKEKIIKRIQELKSHKRKPPEKPKSSVLFSEFYRDRYFPYKHQNKKLAERTYKRMTYNFNYLMTRDFDKPIVRYTAREIEDFLLSVDETRKRQILQGLLNNVFKRALADGIIKENPCAPIEKMKHNGEEGECFSFTEQRHFFQKLFADKNISHVEKCYYIFVYLSGTRRCEALFLRQDDVDEEEKILRIRGTKTDGSDRYFPLFPRIEALLRTVQSGSERFFPFSEYVVQNRLKRCTSNHTLHDLRHTFGTIQICVEKVDIKTVSLWLGHSNIQTTLKIYTHPEQLDRGAFLRGDLSDEERIALMRQKYAEILALIDGYLAEFTQNVPKI